MNSAIAPVLPAGPTFAKLESPPPHRYIDAMPEPRCTVVIPYFNEARWLPATLASLEAQTLRPFRVVLVDNASTDEAPKLAAEWALRQTGIEVFLLVEAVPGNVNARAAATPYILDGFVVFADADTIYPIDYLSKLDCLFDASSLSVVGLIAHSSKGRPKSISEKMNRIIYDKVISRILVHQVHNGAYAQSYRSSAYINSGGYNRLYWQFVLNDHELPNRIWKLGRILMPSNLWVQPSPRRADRRAVRWTLWERLLYHLTLPSQKDWFFYRYMAPRFAKRGQKDTVLRQQNWAPSLPEGEGDSQSERGEGRA